MPSAKSETTESPAISISSPFGRNYRMPIQYLFSKDFMALVSVGIIAIASLIALVNHPSCDGISNFGFGMRALFWAVLGLIVTVEFSFVLGFLERNLPSKKISKISFVVLIVVNVTVATVVWSTAYSTMFPAVGGCVDVSIGIVARNIAIVLLAAYFFEDLIINSISDDYFSPIRLEDDTLHLDGQSRYEADNTKNAELPIDAVEIAVLAQSEGNYLRVVYARGDREDLVRFTLKDFIALVPSDAGFSYRRGGWIAHKFIERAEVKSGKLYIVTKSGRKLEISRRLKNEVLDIVSTQNYWRS